MSFFEEHFDAEAAIVMGVVGAFWGLLRHNDAQQKQHVQASMSRIEDNIDEMQLELKALSNDVVSQSQMTKMDEELSELQKDLNIMREKAVSIERINKIDVEFQGLRETIQRTREAMIKNATAGAESAKRTEDSVERLEKRLDLRCSKL